MSHVPKAETELTTHRIESFSDSVFPIAITLRLLEIKAAHFDDGNARTLASMRSKPKPGNKVTPLQSALEIAQRESALQLGVLERRILEMAQSAFRGTPVG